MAIKGGGQMRSAGRHRRDAYGDLTTITGRDWCQQWWHRQGAWSRHSTRRQTMMTKGQWREQQQQPWIASPPELGQVLGGIPPDSDDNGRCCHSLQHRGWGCIQPNHQWRCPPYPPPVITSSSSSSIQWELNSAKQGEKITIGRNQVSEALCCWQLQGKERPVAQKLKNENAEVAGKKMSQWSAHKFGAVAAALGRDSKIVSGGDA
jgi:hypothetical protein